MKKIYYGWFVCFGCALLFFCTSGLTTNAFTIYLPYILKINHFTNTQTSMITTIRSLTGFVFMSLSGIYYRKCSLRLGMVVAGLSTAMGFFGFGLSKTFFAYCISAVFVGFGYGVGTMVPIAMVLEQWFGSHSSKSVGLCASVTGLSTLGIPSFLTKIIEDYSLKSAFLLEGVIILIMTTGCFCLVRNKPRENNLIEFYRTDVDNVDEIFPKKISFINKRDWILLVPVMLLLGGMTSVAYSHLAIFMVSEGIRSEDAALIITASGIVIMFSKSLYGFMTERITTIRCNWIFGICLVSGLTLSCFAGSNVYHMLFAILLYSAGLGMTTVGLVVWASEWTNEDTFDACNQRFQTLYTASGILFSSLPGILADHFHGSYVPAFIFFTLSAVLVIGFVQLIYYRKKRLKKFCLNDRKSIVSS
ncbi:MAG: MFS transporter [Lachnospiraceae bacterium]|nr:MFS transporter [Lachnospiraceae bacterium]